MGGYFVSQTGLITKDAISTFPNTAADGFLWGIAISVLADSKSLGHSYICSASQLPELLVRKRPSRLASPAAIGTPRYGRRIQHHRPDAQYECYSMDKRHWLNCRPNSICSAALELIVLGYEQRHRRRRQNRGQSGSYSCTSSPHHPLQQSQRPNVYTV